MATKANALSLEDRQPVPSNLPISESEFNRRFDVLFPSLRSRAVRLMGEHGEDIATETYVHARDAWYEGRYTDLTEASGPSGFVRFVNKIFQDMIAREKRRLARRDFSLDGMSEEQAAHNERWWAQLYSEDSRQSINDAEMRSEAKQRLRLAHLTDEERFCLCARIEGKKIREILRECKQRKMELSIATIFRRIESAVAALLAVPDTMIAAPEMDHYEWRIQCDVTIYRAPLTTGSALAREKLALSDKMFQKAA